MDLANSRADITVKRTCTKTVAMSLSQGHHSKVSINYKASFLGRLSQSDYPEACVQFVNSLACENGATCGGSCETGCLYREHKLRQRITRY